MNRRRTMTVWVLLAAGLAVAAGCGAPAERAGSTAPEGPAAAAAPAPPAADDPMVLEALAAADEADGTVDHVVAGCPGCDLAMEGDPEHAMTVGDYTLQFCSTHCRDRFGENPTEGLLALSVATDEDDEVAE